MPVLLVRGGLRPGGLAPAQTLTRRELVKKAAVPIVPVGVAGAYEAYPRNKLLPTLSPLFWPANKGTIAVSYNGKTYYVCCSGCRDEFKASPEKYVKEYEEKKKAKKP